VTIGATKGNFANQPSSRNYQVILKGVLSNPSSVTYNGKSLGPSNGTGPGWSQNTTLQGLVIQPPSLSLSSPPTNLVIVL